MNHEGHDRLLVESHNSFFDFFFSRCFLHFFFREQSLHPSLSTTLSGSPPINNTFFFCGMGFICLDWGFSNFVVSWFISPSPSALLSTFAVDASSADCPSFPFSISSSTVGDFLVSSLQWLFHSSASSSRSFCCVEIDFLPVWVADCRIFFTA